MSILQQLDRHTLEINLQANEGLLDVIGSISSQEQLRHMAISCFNTVAIYIGENCDDLEVAAAVNLLATILDGEFNVKKMEGNVMKIIQTFHDEIKRRERASS